MRQIDTTATARPPEEPTCEPSDTARIEVILSNALLAGGITVTSDHQWESICDAALVSAKEQFPCLMTHGKPARNDNPERMTRRDPRVFRMHDVAEKGIVRGITAICQARTVDTV
jgi:hypothetical protein